MKALILTAAALLIAASPALAGGRSGGATGVGIGIANSSSSSHASSRSSSSGNTTTFSYKRQAPGIGLAGLAASGACLGSASFGGSGPGFSLGFAKTFQDVPCDARENARLLAALGYKAQAVQLLINNSPMIAQVMAPAPGSLTPQAKSYGARYQAVQTARSSSTARGADKYAWCNKWRGDVVGTVCLY